MPRKFFVIFTMVAVAFSGLLWSQVFFPQKDLAFAQVAVGGGYETVINIVNRGPADYQADYYGTVYFWTGTGTPWNPIVNGSPVTKGQLLLNPLGQRQVMTLRLTSSGATPEVGFVYISSDNMTQDNFVEGNLTYNILNGSGELTDSVGIGPSVEFYLATIPFDDFSSVALALANPALPDQSKIASISLKLYDNSGLKGTKVVNLGKNSHYPHYLFEIFNENEWRGVTAGWITIQSEQPIIATALTVKQGQMSSLPVQPSPVSYQVEYNASGQLSAKGKMGLWAEGRFVKGYMRITEVNGETLGTADAPVFSLSGRLSGGTLVLNIDSGNLTFFPNKKGVLSAVFPYFSFFNQSAQSSSSLWYLFTSDNTTSFGTMTLTPLLTMF